MSEVTPGTVNLDRAARVIRDGGVVAFPTETVYGLGADALDALAVVKIFEIKGRPRFDPLIVHVAQVNEARQLVTDWPEAAQRLADRFWPGPLTIVLAKAARVPDIVTAGLPSVGVRVPDHPVALELIRRAGVPIAAPSANRFGAISPTTAEHVRQELGDAVDMILDGGPCRRGVESTVVSLVNFPAQPPVLLRPGATPVEEIEKILGPLSKPKPQAGEAVMAPGMLERHYSPRTKMVLSTESVSAFVKENPVPLALLAQAPALMKKIQPKKKIGLLALEDPTVGSLFAAVEVLTPVHPGDLREAAANLFAAMRRLDTAGLDLIVAELVPEEGLGRAINDRLRRACAPRIQ